MKWIDGYTYQEKKRQKEQWHSRFAWFPTCVGETDQHRKIYVWLIPIERRGFLHCGWEDIWWSYEYREMP